MNIDCGVRSLSSSRDPRVPPSPRPALPAIVLLLLATGCATHYDRIAPVREAFFAGRMQEATVLLDKSHDIRLRNEDCKALDKAMIALTSGNPKDAEKTLRLVRDNFDHLEQKSVAEEAASFLSDDNIKAYSGEDYEKVLIRSFLALSNLMNDGGDVNAYALQISEKQNEVIRQVSAKHTDDPNAILAYKQVALGPYIKAMLAEESPLTLDDATRARHQVVSWNPEFRDGKNDLQRAEHQQPMEVGHGALYVFALVGRGPVKEERAEIATQAALLIADRIVSAQTKRGLPPTLAPVKVPKVRRDYSPTSAVAVQVDGRSAGSTATLVDIGGMAVAQHEARYPQIIAEAVARRVIKKAAIYAIKEGVETTPWSPASIGLNVAGIAWEATESADTRCWSLLPDTIQVLRIELPAGDHELTLKPVAGSAIGGGLETRKLVHIEDGRHTCVLGTFPADRLVGELLVSH